MSSFLPLILILLFISGMYIFLSFFSNYDSVFYKKVCCMHCQQKALHCSDATCVCFQFCDEQDVNIPLGHLKQLKYCVMFCVPDIKETVPLDRGGF